MFTGTGRGNANQPPRTVITTSQWIITLRPERFLLSWEDGTVYYSTTTAVPSVRSSLRWWSNQPTARFRWLRHWGRHFDVEDHIGHDDKGLQVQRRHWIGHPHARDDNGDKFSGENPVKWHNRHSYGRFGIQQISSVFFLFFFHRATVDSSLSHLHGFHSTLRQQENSSHRLGWFLMAKKLWLSASDSNQTNPRIIRR